MRDHLPRGSARAKPKLTHVNSIIWFFIIAIILPEVAKATAPVALYSDYQWNMGNDMAIDRPFGINLKRWFKYIGANTTYSSKFVECH
jgi:hypothetical protein